MLHSERTTSVCGMQGPVILSYVDARVFLLHCSVLR